jgi:hypothetical protein
MLRLARCELIGGWVLGFASLLGEEACAQIALDRLSECGRMEVLAELARDRTSDARCPRPSDTLIRRILRRLGPDASQVCASNDFEFNSEIRFECIRHSSEWGVEVLCLRAIELNEIRDYKATYDRSRARGEQSYLEAASSCKVANDDAASAQYTLMPFVLQIAAEFEFGFIVAADSAEGHSAHILHGFASVDPTISTATQAIEFLHAVHGKTTDHQRPQPQQVGNWLLTTETDHRFYNEFNSRIREAGASAWVDGITLSIGRVQTSPISAEHKHRVLQSVLDRATDLYEAEGFEVPAPDLASKIQNQMSSMLDRNSELHPYGFQGRVPMMSPYKVQIMANFLRPSCAAVGRDGRLGIMLLANNPTPGVASDAGSLVLIVIAEGECSMEVTGSRNYALEILNLFEEEVPVWFESEL